VKLVPKQVLTNLFIAMLWCFLQNDWSAITFISGYLVGIAVIFILRKYLRDQFYLITILNVVKLFFIFLRELLSSSILVIRQVTRPKINITPGIFKLQTDLEGDLEITLLALLLSLTPGSVVIEVSSDNKMFYMHAMDIPASKKSVLRSKKKFETAIKKVTRK
jgi:multicomponent Na+:H+ antiporter subunit E